jgi:4-carboxymuconolactone decarboxylase
MAEDKQPSGAEQAFGDFAPAFVGYTDDVLFGQVWTRPQLSPKERSLVTVATLTTGGNSEQLTYHLGLAEQHGVTEEELIDLTLPLDQVAEGYKAMDERRAIKTLLRP